MTNDPSESESQTLTRSYPKLTDVGVDLRHLASIGWTVEAIEHPLTTRPLRLPVCILRRVSKRYRYRVTYTRRRF